MRCSRNLVVDEYIDFPGYHFGLMSFSNDIEILTPPDEPFTEERSIMQDALANVPNGYGNTNYSAALSQAYTLITTDIAENPEEAPRTTYITIFMSDGVPTDNMGDAHYESIVAQIATLEDQTPGCMKSIFHTAYLQNGAFNEPAYNLLQYLASVGGGTFQHFEDNSAIDFSGLDLSYTRRTYKI